MQSHPSFAVFFAALLAFSPAISAGMPKPMARPGTAVQPVSPAGPDIPALACGANFRQVNLTASDVRHGDTGYIEFRSRLSAAVPSGHIYFVFGRLGPDGKPLTHHIMGLFPKGAIFGIYGGAVAWVPAHVKAYGQECLGIAILNAWRVSMPEEQYQQLLAKAAAKLAKPPLWNMFGYNCNHFASEFGDILGLQKPSNPSLPAFAYLPAYMKANPDRAKKS
jgi:hypothetical protein